MFVSYVEFHLCLRTDTCEIWHIWLHCNFQVKHSRCAVLNYLLTPWCRVLLEKLTSLQLFKKFPAFLWNQKVHYRNHKRPPPVPILGQPNPVQIPTSHLLEIHPNIIHASTPRSPQWSLSLRFPHQDSIYPPLLTHTRHMPSPSHSSRFYHPHNIGWAVQIIQLLAMQSPPFPRYVFPPRSKYFLNTVFTNINYLPSNTTQLMIFIMAYFLHRFIQRHVSALVRSHLQVDFFS